MESGSTTSTSAPRKREEFLFATVPDYCIDEVADQTLAFLLALTRQVVPNWLLIRDGNWGLATSLEQMRTLRDLTVGVVGLRPNRS